MASPFFEGALRRGVAGKIEHLAYSVSMRDEISLDQPASGLGDLVHREIDHRGRLLVRIETHTATIADGHKPEIEQILI